MTDGAKLIVDTLRYCEESGARCGNCPSGHDERGVPNCHSQSVIADLIESMSAQLEQVEKERDGLNIMLAQAQAMLETRTKERDAAIADLKEADMIDCMHCKASNANIILCQCDCENCKIANCVCKTCVKNSNWQWRGVQEVEYHDEGSSS